MDSRGPTVHKGTYKPLLRNSYAIPTWTYCNKEIFMMYNTRVYHGPQNLISGVSLDILSLFEEGEVTKTSRYDLSSISNEFNFTRSFKFTAFLPSKSHYFIGICSTKRWYGDSYEFVKLYAFHWKRSSETMDAIGVGNFTLDCHPKDPCSLVPRLLQTDCQIPKFIEILDTCFVCTNTKQGKCLCTLITRNSFTKS